MYKSDNTYIDLTYRFIYKVICYNQSIYLGLVEPDQAHLIKCFSSADFSQRKKALMELDCYQPGEDQEIENYLETQAEELEKTAKPSTLPSLQEWEAMGMNETVADHNQKEAVL
jgi:hypothetical protein